jgi:hypothetical protein
MSKLKDLIRNETRRAFEHEALSTGSEKRQISIRPDVVTVAKIDTLADILDMSRQGLLDDIMNHGIDDAIDAYCEAHGPDHQESIYKGFVEAFHKRWNERNSEVSS